MKKTNQKPKDLSKSGQKLSSLSNRLVSMTAYQRREQIIERMKLHKFDTAYNLSVEFDVSEKTIYRDVMELSINGNPIAAESGRGGGIWWLGGKRGFPFTKYETEALHIAVAIVPIEYKAAFENLLRERVKVKSPLDKEDIYGILRGGISQRALAAELKITESHLSRILSGQKKPSAELVARIYEYRKGALDNEE